MHNILDNIVKVPFGVYIAFIFIIRNGISMAKTHTVHLSMLFMIPIILILLKFMKLSTITLASINWDLITMSLFLGIPFGIFHIYSYPISIDDKEKRIRAEGTILPLILLLIIFFIRTAGSVLEAMTENLHQRDTSIWLGINLADMFFTGIIMGRAIGYIYRYNRYKNGICSNEDIHNFILIESIPPDHFEIDFLKDNGMIANSDNLILFLETNEDLGNHYDNTKEKDCIELKGEFLNQKKKFSFFIKNKFLQIISGCNGFIVRNTMIIENIYIKEHLNDSFPIKEILSKIDTYATSNKCAICIFFLNLFNSNTITILLEDGYILQKWGKEIQYSYLIKRI